MIAIKNNESQNQEHYGEWFITKPYKFNPHVSETFNAVWDTTSIEQSNPDSPNWTFQSAEYVMDNWFRVGQMIMLHPSLGDQGTGSVDAEWESGLAQSSVEIRLIFFRNELATTNNGWLGDAAQAIANREYEHPEEGDHDPFVPPPVSGGVI